MQDEIVDAMASMGLGSAGPSRPRITQPSASTPIITPELEQVIAAMIGARRFELIGPGVEEQLFDIPYVPPRNGQDFEKIPEIAKLINNFSGEKTKFASWKKSVDRVMELFSGHENTHKYYVMTLAVRNRIIGEAETVLEAHNTPLNWKAMSKCLTAEYGDERDLKTLEYELFSLSQDRMSITEFHKVVYHQLSLILNKIAVQENTPDAIRALTTSYRGKALDTFVRGLNGDLPRLLAIKEPRDLSHALYLCNLLHNQEHRNKFSTKIRPGPPPIPPKQFPNPMFARQQPVRAYNNNQSQFRSFDPTHYHTPKPIVHQPQQQYAPQQFYAPRQTYAAPPRPFAPKPQPRPVPMEVDSSIRSAKINYMNHPQTNNFAGKRPPPLVGPPPKIQRQFHINTGEPFEQVFEEQTDPYNQAEEEIDTLPDPYTQYTEEQNYFAGIDPEIYDSGEYPQYNPEVEITELSDVNFLA